MPFSACSDAVPAGRARLARSSPRSRLSPTAIRDLPAWVAASPWAGTLPGQRATVTWGTFPLSPVPFTCQMELEAKKKSE